MKHLSDHEIQAYLRGCDRNRGIDADAHLSDCSICRRRLRLYERLEDMFRSTISSQIPVGFEKAVMTRLRRTRQQTRRADSIVAAVAMLSILGAGMAIFLVPQLWLIVTGSVMDAWHCTAALTSETRVTAESLAVPLTGILVLMLFAAVDRLIMPRLRPEADSQA